MMEYEWSDNTKEIPIQFGRQILVAFRDGSMEVVDAGYISCYTYESYLPLDDVVYWMPMPEHPDRQK